MPIKMSKKNGQATTTKEHKASGKVIASDTETETVASPENSGAEADRWAEVGVEASYTHNMGNYESCRVGVVLKIPCAVDEINEVFEYASEWIDEKMQKLNAEISS